MPFADYEAELKSVPGLYDLDPVKRAKSPEEAAFWAELALEGLHQSLKLARQDLDSTVSYKEMLKFQLLRPARRGRGRGDIN